MKVLYLIFSHDHQPQLARLAQTIRRLSPQAEIAIHHDPQLAPLQVALFPAEWGVRIVPNPVRAEWGRYSLVEQYLHAFRWSIENLEFDWIVTLTGLTYPIRPLDHFEGMLAASAADGFVYHFDADDPAHWPSGTARTRLSFRYFTVPRFAYWHRVPSRLRSWLRHARIAFNANQPLIRIAPRPRGLKTLLGLRRTALPLPSGWRLQGGRQMLNLTADALRTVLRFVDANPAYCNWMRMGLCPDESFFTTILANSPALQLVNDVQRAIWWPPGVEHAASVAVITSNDLPEVLRQSAPFALKFDSRMDPHALDLIDEQLRPYLHPVRSDNAASRPASC